MLPVVLIHGFRGGKKELSWLKKGLERNGHDVFTFSYPENKSQVKIDTLSRRLEHFIQQEIPSDTISLVGVSQGGIVARNYIQNYSSSKIVKACFTLCSPHKGTLTAYLLQRPGAVDLRPDSRLLRKLNSKEGHRKEKDVDYFSIYAPLDLMVFPGTNAKLKIAKKEIASYSILHPLVFRSPKTLKFILDNLSI